MPFNVDPGVQQAPKYRIDPPKADLSASYLVQGIGNVVDGLVDTADNAIKEDISKTIRKEYDLDNTIFGVKGASVMESPTGAAEKLGTDTPEGIKQAQQQLLTAREAVQQGKLRESNYQSRLVAVMRQLRAQYPGYVDDIDKIATQITGQNPEHAARRALMSEWEQDAKTGRAEAEVKRKNIEQWGESGWLPSNWGSMDYETLRGEVYKRRAMDSDIQRRQSTLDLQAKEQKAQQQDAVDLAFQYVRNTQAIQFTDTLRNMGINSWDDLYKKLEGYKSDGVIDPQEQQQITQVFDQLQQSSNSAFNKFLQQPLGDGPNSKSLESIIQDSSKIEDIRKTAQRELDQMKQNFIDGKLGLFAINKVYHDNMMDGASLEMAKNNPTLLMLNALSRVGGKEAVDAYIRLNPDVLTKMDNKSKGAFFQTQLGSVTQGTAAKDNLTAIDKEKGVDPSVKGEYLKSLTSILKDPNASPEMIKNISTSLFGAGNLDFMSTAPLNDKDKETAFRFLTSPEMSQFMFKNRSTNPEGWSNYRRWVAVSSQSLYQQAASTLQAYVVDPSTEFSVNFDGAKFNINGPSSVPGKDGSYPYRVNPPGDLVAAVEKINAGIANATEVAKLGGEDPSVVFKAFTNGLRLDLSAKKNPTMWDTIRMQMQKMWSTPEENSRNGRQKLGANGNPNGAMGAIDRMAAPVANAIQLASSTFGHDVADMGAIAYVESSGDPSPGSDTGSYKGLYQLSYSEFNKWKQRPDADIYNPVDNAMAAAAKFAYEKEQFKNRTGQDATVNDIYMQHQQGVAGYQAHADNPNGIAWENVRRFYGSDSVAKKAIWGNIPSDVRDQFPGGVNTVTSEDFMQIWKDKIDRFRGDTSVADLGKKASEGDSIMGLTMKSLVGQDLSLTATPETWDRVKPTKSFSERALDTGQESNNIIDLRGLRESLPQDQVDAIVDDYFKRKKQGGGQRPEDDSTDLGQAGLMGGLKAKDKPEGFRSLELNKMLYEKGMTEDQIYKETGFSKGADGYWRFEIDDSNSSLKEGSLSALSSGKELTLKDVLSHDKLFKNYPELESVKVKALSGDSSPKIRGSFNDVTNTLELNTSRDPEEIFSTLIHEVQHSIQRLEDFAPGGGLQSRYTKQMEDALAPIADEAKRRYNELVKKGLPQGEFEQKLEEVDNWRRTEFDRVLKNLRDQRDAEGADAYNKDFDFYEQIMGEVEARNAANRLNMSPEEKRLFDPRWSEDIPRKDQKRMKR